MIIKYFKLVLLITVVAAGVRNQVLEVIDHSWCIFGEGFKQIMSNKSSHVKVLPPRALTDSETSHSLAQWRINFRQYCKKDDAYKIFLKSSSVWDPSKQNYRFTETLEGRTTTQLTDDV